MTIDEEEGAMVEEGCAATTEGVRKRQQLRCFEFALLWQEQCSRARQEPVGAVDEERKEEGGLRGRFLYFSGRH